MPKVQHTADMSNALVKPHLAGCFLGIFLILGGLIFRFFGIDALTRQNLQRDGVLVNGSKFFERWSEPGNGYLKVYFFNLTNPDGVIRGEKVILEEIGPYIYDYSVTKTDLRQTDRDVLQYRLQFRSDFNHNLSGSLSDMDPITIMNYPLGAAVLSGLATGQDIMSLVRRALEQIFPNSPTPFVTSSVKKLLFEGFPLDCSSRNYLVFLICRQLTVQGPQFFWTDENNIHHFALLHSKNSTSSDFYTIDSGIDDVNKRGQIRTFRNETVLKHWRSRFCNKINGSSDGSAAFPTFLTENDRIHYFDGNFGRSFYAEFSRIVDFQGIEAYRFESTENLFANSSENMCYCPRGIPEFDKESDDFICPANGLLNTALFSYAPLIVSLPWFLYGDEDLQKVLPKNHSHEDLTTFLEIEPISGTPVRGAKRLQFNLLLPQVGRISYLEKAEETLIPAVWVEITSEIDDESLELLKNELYKRKVLLGVIYAVIAVGSALVAIFAALLLANHKKSTKTACRNQLPKIELSPQNDRNDKPATISEVYKKTAL